MMSDWGTVKIEDIAEVKSGKRLPKGHQLTGKETPFPYIRLVDIADGRIQKNDLQYLSEETRKSISRYIVNTNDVCLAIVGHSIGMVFYVEDKWDNINLTENAARITNVDESFNSRFIYYYLTSLEGQNEIISRKVGSAQGKLPLYNIKSLELPEIPRNIQDSIVSTLDSLSFKIELNRQTNQTLEHIAQAIFKSWFVDFEPTRAKIAAKQIKQARQDSERSAALREALLADDRWSEAVAAAIAEGDPERAAMAAISGKSLDEIDQLSPEQQTQLLTTAALFPDALVDSELGEIPEGWKEGNVGNVAIAKGGFAFKGKSFVEEGNPVIKIKNITGDGRVDLNGAVCIDDEQAKSSKRFKLEDGDLLMAMTGATVGKIGFVVTEGKSVYLNQRVAKFESEKFGDKIAWFLFCCFERDSIFDAVVSSAQGSAQPNISSSGIESTKLILPSDELIHLFCGKADSLFKKWLSTINENSVLKENRDSLLPKLLSGELQVVDKGKTA
jgi:type I restriction enzyme S subunit